MNTSKLFKLGSLLIVLLMAFSVVAQAQQTMYLNVTDGDDSYTGANATNNPAGTGPKRTFNGIVAGVASLTAGSTVTINVAAGTYNINQSGIGGGNDAAGVSITGNYNYVFNINTYNSLTTATIPAGLTVNVSSTRTVTFKANDAGVQDVTVTSVLTLTAGTLDVSQLKAFNVSSGATVTRTEGSVNGAVTYSGNYTVVFNGTTSKTAGTEVPASIGTGTLTVSQASGTVTFPNVLSASTTTGGVQLTGAGSAVFNATVTLALSTTTPGAPLIQNTAAGSLTFAGGISVSARGTGTPTTNAFGNFIVNGSTGSLTISGPLTFTNNTTSTSAAYGDVTANIVNSSTGTVNVSGIMTQVKGAFSSSVSYDFIVSASNASTGTLSFGSSAGASTLNGTLANGAAGTVNINGAATVSGAVTNDAAGKINVNAATTFAAALSNNNAGSSVVLGGNTLTLTAATTHTNAGSITSSGIGTGGVVFSNTGAITWNGTGAVPNVTNSNTGAVTFAAAKTINGNVTSTSGGFTFSAAHTITGAVNVSGGTVTAAGALTIQGGVSLTGGTFALGGAGATVTGLFNMTGGTLNFGSWTLDLKGNFNRTSGTVTPGTGTLQLSSGGGQTFNGGANFTVNTLQTSGIGTSITFGSSIIVAGNATINSNTTVILGTYNIRMSGDNATFTQSGNYTSAAGGGIIFEAPTADQTMTGTGIYSNVEVRLGTVTKNVLIPAATTVTFSGTLTFTRGGIGLNNGSIFNPSSILVTPSVLVNLGGAPDGKGVILDVDADATNGTFNATATPYHLTYFGALTADRNAGPEFVTGAVPSVINLSITTTGAFSVLLSDAVYKFTGNLTINTGATLKINGTTGGNDLTATGNGAVLNISGALDRTAANAGFIISGTGVTMNGGDNSGAATSQGRVTSTTVSSGASLTVSGMREFKSDLTNNGSIVLGLATVTGDATSGQVTGTYTGAGDLTLAASAVFAGTVTHNSGAINLVNFNLTYKGTTYNRAAGTAATYTNAPTATSNGILIFATSATVNMNGGTVPRVTVNGAGITVTLGGNATVSDQFIQTVGDVALGANTLTLSGSTWTYTAGLVTGTGTVAVTGTTTLTAAGNLSLPNLTVNTTGTFTVASSSSTTPRTITVVNLLTQTAGAIALGPNDITLTLTTGNAYTYTAGTVTGTTSATVSSPATNIGEIVFDPGVGNTSNLNLTASGLSVSNLTVNSGTMAVAGTGTFTVANRLTFGDGAVTGIQPSTTVKLSMADNSWIIRWGAGTGTLDKAPALVGVVNVYYKTTASVGSGVELPTSATTLKDLTVDVAANTLTFTAASSTTAVVVNGKLTLTSGTLAYGSTRPLQIATGGTIEVRAGLIDATSATAAVAPLGAYNLVYTGPQNISTTSKEWPSTASITSLTVTVGDATTPANYKLFLSASRTVTNFTLSAATAASGIDLSNSGATATSNLTVTGTTTITTGTVFATAVGGVNGQLITQGDLSMTGGTFGAGAQLVFSGAANQTFTLGSAQTVSNLTINKTAGTSVPTITLAGANLTVSGVVTFVNGLFITQDKVLILAAPASPGLGFDRLGVTGANVSHIVGNVRKTLSNTGSIVTSTNERSDFPVGTMTDYRPAALTFKNTQFGIPTVPNGVSFTVAHTNTKPEGIVGLPIANGIAAGVDIARYPKFYWTINTSASLGSTVFNLELTAAGYGSNPATDFDDVANVRIIRRNGSITDVTNQWLLQGAASSYDNYVLGGVPTVVNINATGGLIPGGAIYTYGLKSTMTIANPIANVNLTDAATTFTRNLTNPALFTGAQGAITYSVAIGNPAVATVAIANNILTVTRKVSGATSVTVTGTDGFDGSRISHTFQLSVVSDVEEPGVVPTEFTLSQNFPNPFNPSTTIRFALPKEAPVTLEIYNILGMKIRTLISGQSMNAAFHTVVWDGKDDAGVGVPSGMYLYRIHADKFQASKKMTLLK